MLVLSGLACALWGAGTRPAPVAWGALAFCVVVALFADAFRLPGWVVDLSPFSHVGQLPAEPFSAPPVIALATIAVVLSALGHVLFVRRDVHSG